MKSKLLILCLLFAFTSLIHAAEAKLDLTGTWKQTQPVSKTRETTFTFKLQDQALTGTVLKPNGPVAITNGVVKGDQVSFQTCHEASAPKGTIVTTTYTGKLSSDTNIGTRAGKTDAMDYGTKPWQIKRETAKPNKEVVPKNGEAK